MGFHGTFKLRRQDIRLIYANGRCWSSLKRDAGRICYEDNAVTKCLVKNLGNLLHYNTASFLRFVEDFLLGEQGYREPERQGYATMLYYALYGVPLHKLPFSCDSLYEALEQVHQTEYVCFKEEMLEVVDYLLNRLEITTAPLGEDVLPGVELYGCYTRSDIFSLVGKQTVRQTMQGQVAGVFELKDDVKATLLFVTLNKSDKDFSPSTQYDDYIINKDYFHWQSQNSDRHNNRGGKVYTLQPQNRNKIILFVREEKRDGFGNTLPFHCFGLVDYVSSHGDSPMNITWKLREPVMAKYLVLP